MTYQCNNKVDRYYKYCINYNPYNMITCQNAISSTIYKRCFNVMLCKYFD